MRLDCLPSSDTTLNEESASCSHLFFFFSSSDPQRVQPLRPDGSHERNVTGGDPTAASGGSAKDERGQRQSGTSDSHGCL